MVKVTVEIRVNDAWEIHSTFTNLDEAIAEVEDLIDHQDDVRLTYEYGSR